MVQHKAVALDPYYLYYSVMTFIICHLILFADDTTMVNSHKNLNYLEYMMHHDLTILLEWFSANQLSLNLSKTVMMNFWPGKKG